MCPVAMNMVTTETGSNDLHCPWTELTVSVTVCPHLLLQPGLIGSGVQSDPKQDSPLASLGPIRFSQEDSWEAGLRSLGGAGRWMSGQKGDVSRDLQTQ